KIIREDNSRSYVIQHVKKDIEGAVSGRVESAGSRQEIQRPRLAGHVSVSSSIHGDADGVIEIEAAQEGRIDETRSGGIQLRDERVVLIDPASRTDVDVEGSVECAPCRRKIGRFRLSPDIHIPRRVEGHAASPFEVTAAQESRI